MPDMGMGVIAICPKCPPLLFMCTMLYAAGFPWGANCCWEKELQRKGDSVTSTGHNGHGSIKYPSTYAANRKTSLCYYCLRQGLYVLRASLELPM